MEVKNIWDVDSNINSRGPSNFYFINTKDEKIELKGEYIPSFVSLFIEMERK